MCDEHEVKARLRQLTGHLPADARGSAADQSRWAVTFSKPAVL